MSASNTWVDSVTGDANNWAQVNNTLSNRSIGSSSANPSNHKMTQPGTHYKNLVGKVGFLIFLFTM